MPSKRYERKPVDFLHRDEVDALLKATNTSMWVGRRDRVLLTVAIQTGLRVSELIELKRRDFVPGSGAHVHCEEKGRKHRSTPLRHETAALVDAWLRENSMNSDAPLFPSTRGGALSRDAVERLVAKYSAIAQEHCPKLGRTKVTPHMLRHTAAMDLLQHGVDRSVIALWLGHESIQTTEIYLHADMKMKSDALARTTPFGVKPGRYRASERVTLMPISA